MKVKVLCKVIQHAEAHGKKDDVIEVPDHIGAALIKAKRAEEVKETKSKKSE